jgi:hypothetical protein
MDCKKHLCTPLLTSLAIAGGLCFTASAQVGNGPWTSESPGYNLQLVGSGWNNGTQYGITSTSTTTEQRAERRYDDFSTGTHQFEGYVTVNSLGGDRICLKQTFQDNTGPWTMIAVSKSGYLYAVEDGDQLANYTVGTNVRINTICYTGSAKDAIWINGSLIEYTLNGTPPYYHKFGTYRTGSGKGPITATWTGIKFWYK